MLSNPVFHALLTGDSSRSEGTASAKFFDPDISPFVGFDSANKKGFDELYHLMPPGRKILYACREKMDTPKGWELIIHIEGLQFLFTGMINATLSTDDCLPLDPTHVTEMIALAKLTKPGPFDKRTIEFGHYYGIFDNGRLAAMTGQRLHPGDYSEVSAVCTHPDFSGKGYARQLLLHQVQLILSQRKKPFLHVRADNSRAIDLYEKNGFTVNGPMQFYFLKRNE
jgi:ribosomal protein S18 acetylase RimI-like enzyme